VKTFVMVVLLASLALAQDSDKALRDSIDVRVGPRSLLLRGGDVDSPSGQYMIEFPFPNECVILGPIKAQSRSFALYRAMSRGGFKLKPSQAAITVWTVEEWNDDEASSWWPQYSKAHAKRCGPATSK
jgi:hypothetical protein